MKLSASSTRLLNAELFSVKSASRQANRRKSVPTHQVSICLINSSLAERNLPEMTHAVSDNFDLLRKHLTQLPKRQTSTPRVCLLSVWLPWAVQGLSEAQWSHLCGQLSSKHFHCFSLSRQRTNFSPAICYRITHTPEPPDKKALQGVLCC